MDDDSGAVIGVFIIIVVVGIVIYIAIMASMVIAAGGALWGSGTAIKNYIESFKENMIDSNRNITVNDI